MHAVCYAYRSALIMKHGIDNGIHIIVSACGTSNPLHVIAHQLCCSEALFWSGVIYTLWEIIMTLFGTTILYEINVQRRSTATTVVIVCIGSNSKSTSSGKKSWTASVDWDPPGVEPRWSAPKADCLPKTKYPLDLASTIPLNNVIYMLA